MQHEKEMAFVKNDFGNGMTLRDYFAAKAMQGSLANSADGGEWGAENIAKWSYKVADAMIKKRSA